jgi:hypothetical protein
MLELNLATFSILRSKNSIFRDLIECNNYAFHIFDKYIYIANDINVEECRLLGCVALCLRRRHSS